jgi:hypothetical protein
MPPVPVSPALTSQRWRAIIHKRVPEWLRYLGVPHPYTAWQRARAELSALRKREIHGIRVQLAYCRLAIIASIVARERGDALWITREDVAEAHLRIMADQR